ncbi:MAG TPA: hypothetical protein VFC73_06735 [Syntrophomonadaceae bacterium]|nr:hypothetical protein [Syntrophomonadaceae bacterium]
MNKNIKGLLSLAVLGVFFGLGYLLGSLSNNIANQDINQKPVVDLKEKRELINEDTQIIYEQRFTKCDHTIISQFDDRQNLEGKSIEQIRQIYTVENGYKIEFDDSILVIHQEINDWCDNDKEKYRLKDYQGRVAIYKGPDIENDILQKVTNIYMNSLPGELQEKIRQGKWEFKDNESINDALENLDEYL